jgi:2,5-furandicarboxylate decarboxylase 1
MQMQDGFRDFVKRMEDRGELLRIGETLSPAYEISAAIRQMDDRTDKLVQFESVGGYTVPVVWNLLGGCRIAYAMGLDARADVSAEFFRRTANPLKPRLVESGPVLDVQVRGTDVLKTIPVLLHHAGDSSPYFTSAVIIAKDPATGLQSMGIHRVQVRGRGRLGILLNSPPVAEFWQKHQKLGRNMEIAIVIGIDPLTWLASVSYAPHGIDKYELAGALRQHPIELVQCRQVDLSVPAEAEFLIEGRVLAGTMEVDGPFGEVNGVYGTFQSPTVEVLSISHRTQPIYHALLPRTDEEAKLMSVSWGPQVTRALQTQFPWVTNAYVDEYDYGTLIIQIAKPSESAPRELIGHALGLLPRVKTVVVVDRDIDIHDRRDVAFALATRLQPDRDVVILADMASYPLDPSATETNTGYRGSKIGFDATMPLANHEKFAKVVMPDDANRKAAALLERYLGK